MSAVSLKRSGQPDTRPMPASALLGYAGRPPDRRRRFVSPDAMRMARLIKLETCRQFDVLLEDMMSEWRWAPAVLARHVAMWLHRKMIAGASFPAIAQSFARSDDPSTPPKPMDHTSVMHAVRRIDALVANDDGLSASIGNIIVALVGDA